MKSNYFNFSILFFLLCCIACGDEENMTPCATGKGFVIEDGNCVCVDDKITVYGNCIAIPEGNYYGITDGCACSDTLIWEITEPENGGDTRTIRINNTLSFSGDFADEAFRLKKTLFGLVRETSMGDSLFIMPDSVLIACQALPDEALPQQVLFEGLFSADKDTLAATLTYVNNPATNPEIISTCEVNFIRQ